MKISRWGNSLAVRLPATLVEDLGLRPGDEVDIQAASRTEPSDSGVAPGKGRRLRLIPRFQDNRIPRIDRAKYSAS